MEYNVLIYKINILLANRQCSIITNGELANGELTNGELASLAIGCHYACGHYASLI